MQARRTGFSRFAVSSRFAVPSSFAVALAVHLGVPGAARAEDATLAARPQPALGAATMASNRDLLRAAPLTFRTAFLPGFVLADGGERGSNRRTATPRLDLDVLFQGSSALEWIGAFVLPGRRGVPVATSNGGPSLSLAMMRTDLTRGSGLCALGKF